MLGRSNDRKLIGANGAPVEDDVNIQTIGPHGPAPSQDVWLIAKRFRSSARVRMMPVRTACAVAHGISRYTRAKTFTAIGRRLRVFRRSPVYLVRPTLLDSTTRRIFGDSQNILRDQLATVRRPDRHMAWTLRRYGCGLRCRRSKPGGTATRHRCITSGKVAVYGGVIRCAAGFSTHTSVSMAPTPHYLSDSPGVDVCSTLFDDACKGEAECRTTSRTGCS